ncbi:MAG: glycyl-radical enzyme activating protein [Deltaproteobacteria bacterium]|nr:glycyl-radical enzyme activating protein [Deltaproteobacteria bacterium]
MPDPGSDAPERPPLIVDIKGNALDDGPGIRAVVFFKGCPLRCAWCHNPEAQRPGVELSFDPARCVGCESCLEVCGRGALSRADPGFVDRERCDRCLACAAACPAGALETVGETRSVEQVLAAVAPYRVFFDTSGGGVTLSGGEPTLFMDYLGELLRALKAAGVHTLLQTCGLFDWKRFASAALPYLDAVYYDIKLMDDDAHRSHCGASNRVILDNFRRLQAVAEGGVLELLPRTPLVPGITDSDGNVRALAEFLRGCGVHRCRLLDYNPLWPDKAAKLGAASEAARRPELRRWLERGHVARLEAILHRAGIETGGGER